MSDASQNSLVQVVEHLAREVAALRARVGLLEGLACTCHPTEEGWCHVHGWLATREQMS